jgi:hypothetical protein
MTLSICAMLAPSGQFAKTSRIFCIGAVSLLVSMMFVAISIFATYSMKYLSRFDYRDIPRVTQEN